MMEAKERATKIMVRNEAPSWTQIRILNMRKMEMKKMKTISWKVNLILLMTLTTLRMLKDLYKPLNKISEHLAQELRLLTILSNTN